MGRKCLKYRPLQLTKPPKGLNKNISGEGMSGPLCDSIVKELSVIELRFTINITN